MKPTILLSYDVEEFDMPMEYGGTIGLEEQLEISTNGLNKLLSLLNKYNIKCTFYCTAQYALHRRELIQSLHRQGFEIASHGYYHTDFEIAHLKSSREVLEEITGCPVYGYRMARMMPLDPKAVADAGYAYNSSINPTWLPGRYNNLSQPRTVFFQEKLLQLPASVTPFLRVPLFWLSFHNFPISLYLHFCHRAIASDGYLNIYFHPWEFEDFANAGGAKFPAYILRNRGAAMYKRTERLIQWGLKKNFQFNSTFEWLKAKQYLDLRGKNPEGEFFL